METKQCSKCKRILPIENFRWKNKSQNLHHSQCKQCQSKREKERYLQDKQRKDAIIQRTLSYKERNLEYIKQRKACGCAKCGEKRFYVLDFHHLDKKQKNDTINNLRTCSLDTLSQEIDKCIVLCSNCHREFHYLENYIDDLTIESYLNNSFGGPGA